jgi:MoaA/NifB/PqqE/SkfB family radical SAM enzyme
MPTPLESPPHIPPPPVVVWDITYACPLRCAHCYSESGRRPSRQLGRTDMVRVINAILALRPEAVVFAGGEPLLVPSLIELARRARQRQVEAWIHTSGWRTPPPLLAVLGELFNGISVSVDGAAPEVHDAIRGRAGSFDRAMATLEALSTTIAALRRSGRPSPRLGVDFTVTRSNFDHMTRFCSHIAPRFEVLDTISFGSVIPIGLASRESFQAELLTEAQLAALRGDELAEKLRALAPAGTQVETTDNATFQMHPDRIAAGDIPRAMQVEPDGAVRAMSIYEGTIGNLLDEDGHTLWRRAVQRWSEPFVTEKLRAATTQAGWATATRQIDMQYGTSADRERITNRPPFVPFISA